MNQILGRTAVKQDLLDTERIRMHDLITAVVTCIKHGQDWSIQPSSCEEAIKSLSPWRSCGQLRMSGGEEPVFFKVIITPKPKIKSLFWVLEKAVLASLNQSTRNPSFVTSLM